MAKRRLAACKRDNDIEMGTSDKCRSYEQESSPLSNYIHRVVAVRGPLPSCVALKRS